MEVFIIRFDEHLSIFNLSEKLEVLPEDHIFCPTIDHKNYNSQLLRTFQGHDGWLTEVVNDLGALAYILHNVKKCLRFYKLYIILFV